MVTKDSLRLVGWLKEVAPSDKLRKWFKHDPTKWLQFQHRYFVELREEPETWQPLVQAERTGNITLAFRSDGLRSQ